MVSGFARLGLSGEATWTSLIGGYSRHCDLQNALMCFCRMRSEGFEPNAATFASLLPCYGRLGLVHAARDLFCSMSDDHGVKPAFEHYGCLADALARSGHLPQALSVLHSMPASCRPHCVGSRILLSRCTMHGNAEIADDVFDHLSASESCR
jgi:pentatricopeptide repeat protein